MCPANVHSVAMFAMDAVAARLIREEAAVHKRRRVGGGGGNPSVEISHVLPNEWREGATPGLPGQV